MRQLRAKFEQVFGTERLAFGVVEGFDVRPFQTNHVERQRKMSCPRIRDAR